MTDRPINMIPFEIWALLEGRKTQTRRFAWWRLVDELESFADGIKRPLLRPFTLPTIWQGVQPGDRLWVRESWQYAKQQYCRCPQGTEAVPCDDWAAGIGCRSVRDSVVYFADGASAPKWRPAVHMPRWASRITLVVTEVRRQRLQAISEEDAAAEGARGPYMAMSGGEIYESGPPTYRDGFRELWNSIHGPGAWDANPEVVALAFEVHRCNIDAMDKAQATERAR